MEQCKKLQRKLHKEKLEFLKNKGLYFSCLMGGHMSNACEEKKSCQICLATHPTLLHIKQKLKDLPKEEASKEEPKEESSKKEQKLFHCQCIHGCRGSMLSDFGRGYR